MTGSPTKIEGTNLNWIRTYHPGTRKLDYMECWTDIGRYRLTLKKDLNTRYKLSHTSDGGPEVDLGYYLRRADAERRLIGHLTSHTAAVG